MNSAASATCDVDDYVGAVATALGAESVEWPEGGAFDAVVTLPSQIAHFPGQQAVLAWNRHFGWSLGVNGRTPGNLVILGGLGVGRTPQPARCADRAAELIADHAGRARPEVWTPRAVVGDRLRLVAEGDVNHAYARLVRGRVS
ncbi:DUF6292 family protein [Rhodococcus sp. NPDC058514]|uniref:DUF6292 family protein n=1 Tax=unclassified Rhodococcus (in: high G+C Gram-positive bacteria) TaxID=192944 RepID=UPI00365B4950